MGVYSAVKAGARTLVCSALFALRISTVLSEQKSAHEPPHIVFIVADDLGWNDVGWHNPEMLTPNLNSLAERGIKLEASYVQPTCTPSRNSFMTGMFPFHTELQKAMDPSSPTFLPLKYPTMAEKLKQQGYATHMVGKWHLGYCNEKYTPVRRGFDSFLGFYMGSQDHYTHKKTGALEENLSSSTTFSSFGHVLMSSFLGLRTKGLTQGRDFRYNTTVWRKTEGTYSTHAFTDRAIEIIKRHDPDEPLFLYLPYQAPHSPLEVPASYEQLYSHIRSRERRIYSGMVSALDEAVGHIVDSLQETGLMDNTLLVFTSDNGGSPYMGGNNLPLRGGKNTIWEGGTRVPTFVYSPALLPSTGRVSNELFHAVDWFPTFLEAAGAPTAQGIDGVSQWSFLTKGENSARTEFVYSIWPSGKGAIRVGDYKLIFGKPGQYNDWYPVPGSEKIRRKRFRGGKHDNVTLEQSQHFLFNIKDDPSETHNVALEFPDLVKELMERFAALNLTKVEPHLPRRAAQADPSLYGGFWTPGWC